MKIVCRNASSEILGQFPSAMKFCGDTRWILLRGCFWDCAMCAIQEKKVTSNSLNHVLHVIKWQIKNIFGGNIFWNVHHSGKTTSYLKLLILSWQHGSRGDFLKRVQTVLKLSDIGCQSPW